MKPHAISVVVSYLAVCAVAGFLLFYRLDSPSINTKDEFLHIFATQGMWQGGSWWKPQIDGKPYFHKPPLKMWLSFIPLAAFGEGTWVYRLPDALSGLIVVSLVFFCSVRWFGSVLGAAVGAIALLGCKSLMFVHGFRMANQDAMLILLSASAVLCGIKLLENLELLRSGQSHARRAAVRYAMLCGCLVGFAALVKSAGAYIVFAIGAAPALALLFRRRITFSFWAAAAVLLPSLALPAVYFVPHYYSSKELFNVAIKEEIAQRVTHGYHNRGQKWYYLQQIFREQAGIPPELFLAAIAFGIYWIYRERSVRSMVVLCWAVVPIVLFSVIPSRNSWYISPALPGLALLLAGFTAELIPRRGTLFKRGVMAAVLCWTVGRAGWFAVRTAESVVLAVPPIGVDQVATAMLPFIHRNAGTIVLEYGKVPWMKHERVYAQMLRKQGRAKPVATLQEIKAAASHTFAWVAENDLQAAMQLGPFVSYAIVPPYSVREQQLFVFSYTDLFTSPLFRPAKETIESDCMSGTPGRVMLEGDLLRRLRGTKITLSAAVPAAAGQPIAGVEVFLEGQKIGAWENSEPGPEGISFDVGPGLWPVGPAAMEFKLRGSDGQELVGTESAFCVNKVEVAINMQ